MLETNMKRNVSSAPPESVQKEVCHHYWIIESARGPVSRGVCKFCGAQKEFHNSWPYFPMGKQPEPESPVGSEVEGP